MKKNMNDKFVDACGFNHLEKVQYLISQGCDIHVYNDLGFRRALVKFLIEKYKFLISNSIDSIYWVVLYNHLNIIEYFQSKRIIKMHFY